MGSGATACGLLGNACVPPLLLEHAQSTKLAAMALLAQGLVKRTFKGP
jgi:hypothetical protein